MKKLKGFGLVEVLIIVVVTAFISCLATGVIMNNNSSVGVSKELNDDEDLNNFIEAYNTLLSKYYDKDVDKSEMLKEAEKAMISYLGDKYTTYLDSEEYSDLTDKLSGRFSGIGITLEENKVISVLEDSPAYESGIKVGDIITKINGTEIDSSSSSKISDIVSDDSVNKYTLEVNRDGETLNFEVQKSEISNNVIATRILDNNVGYIKISLFGENLEDSVSKSLKTLEISNIKGLTIDLRDNVGGYLSSAENTASLFLEQGKRIYSLKTSSNTMDYDDKTKEKRTYPIVVLINGNTASSAEILSAALKDSYGAYLVGVKSYGKGVVQQVSNLSNGDSVKITVGEWLTPQGKCINNIGLTPDYEVEYAKSDDEKYDSQILKGIDVIISNS